MTLGKLSTEMEIDQSKAFAVAGQTRRLTFDDKPSPNSQPRVPAKIKALISELGLRYRPTSQADLEAHAGALALLCTDLADAPPHLLERAIRQHAVASPYLPKASDLVRLMQGLLNETRPAAQPGARIDQASKRNAAMDQDPNARQDIRWVYDAGGQQQLVSIAEYRALNIPAPRAEAAE